MAPFAMIKSRRQRRHFLAFITIVSVLFLYRLHAIKKKALTIDIGSISPLVNFRTVRVSGVLEADARRLRSGSILYVVEDGTGRLAVFSDQHSGRALPSAGTPITAMGSLKIGAGHDVRMQAKNVVLTSAPEKRTALSKHRKGERVTVQGRILRIRKPRTNSKAPYKMAVQSDDGILDVIHWLGELPDIETGDAVEVTGRVNVYRDKAELRLWHAGNIKKME